VTYIEAVFANEVRRHPRSGGIRAQIESFSPAPVNRPPSNPAGTALPLTAENYSREIRGSRLTLQAWDRTRNWSRRLAITEATNARLP
jgi:hypothetical protein